MSLFINTVIDNIDEVFGKGFARSHPELVGSALIAFAMMEIAAAHYQLVSEVGNVSFNISEVGDAIKEAGE